MLTRAALILRDRQPFVDWSNAGDPSPTSHALTLAEVSQEGTVYHVEAKMRTNSPGGSPVISRSSSRWS